MDGTGVASREVTSIEGVGRLCVRNGYLRGLLHCLSSPISPNRTLPQVFAQKRPFSHVHHCAAPGLALTGERPLRPTDCDILGMSEDVWALTEKCWHKDPSIRPHVADILAFFDKTSRGWVSPTSEAIANLGLGRLANQNSPAKKSIDAVSETAHGTTDSGIVGQSLV